jgi:hypothetical protein
LVRYDPAAVVRHEWHDRDRRLETRYSYAFGIGALCGLWVRRGDRFAIRMALSYALDHTGKAIGGARRHDVDAREQHVRALHGLARGACYGLTA